MENLSQTCYDSLIWKWFLSPFSVVQSAFAHIYLCEKCAVKWLTTPSSDKFDFSWLGQRPWKVWTAAENQGEFRLDGFGAPSANWQVQTKVRKVQFYFIFSSLQWLAVSPKNSSITLSWSTFFFSVSRQLPTVRKIKKSSEHAAFRKWRISKLQRFTNRKFLNVVFFTYAVL